MRHEALLFFCAYYRHRFRALFSCSHPLKDASYFRERKPVGQWPTSDEEGGSPGLTACLAFPKVPQDGCQLVV